MKNKIKKALITTATTLSAILIVTTATYAIGTLTPSGTAGDDTQYSLNDIYSKLVDFTDTSTATSSPFTVPGTLSASFNTLSEIYGLLEAEEDDLVPENIAEGVEIFGIEGNLATTTPELEWFMSQSVFDLDFDGRTSYCSTLDQDGAGWRVPSIQELSNGIVEQFILNTKDNNLEEEILYPSSTEVFGDNTEIWAFDLRGTLTIETDSKSTEYTYFVCVR